MKRIKSGFVETTILVGFAIIAMAVTAVYFSQNEKQNLTLKDSRKEVAAGSLDRTPRVGEPKTTTPEQKPGVGPQTAVVRPPSSTTTPTTTPAPVSKPAPAPIIPVPPVAVSVGSAPFPTVPSPAPIPEVPPAAPAPITPPPPASVPETTASPFKEPSGVRLISTVTCSGSTCYTLGVTCEGIPERQIEIKTTSPVSPKGAVVLDTGGRSVGLYSLQSTEQKQTVKTLVDNNFEVFELYWKNGWPAGAEGFGFRKAMCGYAEAVQWIASSKAKQPQTMCAQGNSAGGFSIGYGLSSYGLENILDMAILSGGPPASRFDASCFGTTDPALLGALWPAGAGGRGLVDIAMGWAKTGSYCKNGGPSSTDRVKALQDTSLVSPTESRDYSFPKTKVNFVNSEGDYSAAHTTGKIYYEVIATAKAWYQIAGSEHGIDATPEGANKIRELFLSECVAK